ncbi:hypothetical protein BJX99DRAFT_270308 [Aspergillus californicus]
MTLAVTSMIFLTLLLVVLAQNKTGTPDSERVGWVSSPNVRSTSEILWSCLSIFLVCSWKCVHLNIPSSEESEAGWHTTLQGWLPYWPTGLYRRLLYRRLKWMIFIAMAPEFVHIDPCFFACMGGFVIAAPKAKLTHEDTGFEYYYLDEWKVGLFQATDEETGNQGHFPVVADIDIDNLSKTDAFTKAFAVFQCGWLVIQSITRASQGLALTELELATLAFIACALSMYGFWWCKAFDSQRTIPLLCLNREKASLATSQLQLRTDYMRCSELDEDSSGWAVASMLFYATAIVFSAIHLIAWNWDFPSSTNQVLWRTFSLMATFGLLVLTFYCFSSMPAAVYTAVDWNNVLPDLS